MTWYEIYKASALWPGEMVGVECQHHPIVLINIDGHVRAYADRCAHKAVRISRGTLHDHVVRCAAHGWEYDAMTGAGLNPKKVCLQAYPVAIRDDMIFVEITTAKERQHGAL